MTPCHHGLVIMPPLSVLGAVVLALATAGCSGGVPTPPAPLAGTQVPPTPSPSPRALSAGEQLAQRADLGLTTDFAARYTLTNGGVAEVLTFFHLAGGERIDRESGASLTTLLRTPQGTVACSGRAPSVTCRTVAGGDGPVPAEFDVSMQRVLVDDLAQLARTASAYDVVDAVAPSPTASTPQTSCWQVSPRTGAPEPAARAGVYCFGPDGVPTAITYPGGNLALSERLPLPELGVLTPPATPLP